MRNLDGKTCVVTGAASGIGRAVAALLSRRGCHLALVDVAKERLDETASEVRREDRRLTLHEADVRDAARVEALAAEVVEQHGGVQILVNNAGVTAWGRVEDQDLEDMRWVIDVNLWGVIHGCKLFLPHLRQESEAHIVNVSSLFGILAASGQAAYCASKYAVRGFSEALACELEGTGIGVTSVHPGGVATRFVTDSRAVDDTRRAAFEELVKKGAIGPEKVATAIVKGIEKDKLRVRVAPDAFVGDWAKRLFPTAGQRVLARFLAKQLP
jgi:NAD(P)-dependent dehydrogenase (short-subunit alcohol dehydrogenase family)